MAISEVETPAESIEDFTERVRAWAAEHMTPRGASGNDDLLTRHVLEMGLDPNEQVDRGRAILRLMYDAGFGGIAFPKEYGGQGLPFSYQRAFNRAVEGYDLHALQWWVLVLGMNAPALLEFGTEEQKRYYLPRILRGEDHWIQFLSEPTGGSDLAGAITRADLDGNEWVINGSKVWTTLADKSDLGMCLVRTNWDVPKHSGLSVLIVPLRTPGLEVVPIRLVSGQTGFCQEYFSDVRVPKTNLLGSVDDGWNVASRLLVHERNSLNGGSEFWQTPGGMGAGPASPAGASRDGLVELATETGQSGDTHVRQVVADAYLRTVVGSQLGPRIMTAMRKQVVPPAASSILKLMVSENGIRRSDVTAELAGSSMAAWKSDDSQSGDRATGYLSRQGGSILSGTSEIQRNLISERILDLPREAGPDRNAPFKELRHNKMPTRPA